MHKKLIIFVIAVISLTVAIFGISSYISHANDKKMTREKESQVRELYEKCINSELSNFDIDEIKKQTDKDLLNECKKKLEELKAMIKSDSKVVNVDFIEYESRIDNIYKACEEIIGEIEEKERIEAARIEAERIENERIEAERIEAERIEAARIEAEKKKEEAELPKANQYTYNSTENKNLQKGMSADEFNQAHDIAVGIANKYANQSTENQLIGIYKELRRITETVKYSDKDAHYSDIYGFFVLHSCSCAGATRSAGVCLNILGIEYEHVNENKWQHQWCRVKVGDIYWICDPFGMYVGQEPAPYKHPYIQ